MTALTQFERLESDGLWTETTDDGPRDVIVSFGKATLVLTDKQERPLVHWSLPALTRLNPGERPAIFTVDPASDETLEIEDDLMIDAIETVRKAVIKSVAHPKTKRGFVALAVVGLLTAGVVIWGPSAFTSKTLSVVPDSKRSEIGAIILGHYQRLTGPTCRNALGTAPLTKLKTRLMGRDTKGQIVVVQTLPQGATVLPGGIVLVDRALIERLDDPAITAGFILAAISGRDSHDPLEDVLADAGLSTTFRLFTTGDLPNDVLRSYAQTVQKLQDTPTDIDSLITAFDAANVPLKPYSSVSDPDNAAFGQITESGSVPILTDSDWVRLQGICAS